MFNSMRKNNSLLIVAAIFCIGIFLRIYKLDTRDPWFDETCTMRAATATIVHLPFNLASPSIEDYSKPRPPEVNINQNDFNSHAFFGKRSIAELPRATLSNDDGAFIAYNIALYAWMKVFGVSIKVARALSALSGILTIGVGLLICWELSQGFTSLIWTALNLSFHPLLVSLSREARGYSFAIFFASLSLYAILKISVNRNSHLIQFFTYVISVPMAFMSHYLAAFTLFWQIVFFSFKKPRIISAFVLATISTGIAFYIWNYHFDGIFGFNAMAVHGIIWKERAVTTMPEIRATFQNVLHGALELVAQTFNLRTLLTHTNFFGSNFIFGWISLISFVLIGFGFKRVVHSRLRHFLLICTGPIVFSICLALKDGHTLSMLSRYCSFAIIPASALLGVVASEFTKIGRAFRTFGIGIFLLQWGVFSFIANKAVFLEPLNPLGLNVLVSELRSNEKRDRVLVFRDVATAGVVNLFLQDVPAYREKLTEVPELSFGDVAWELHEDKISYKLIGRKIGL